MQVEFRTRRLLRAYEHGDVAVRLWGADAARWYANVITFMRSATGARDLFAYGHMRFHPLHGDKAGKHTADLTNRWRLIVTLEGGTVTVEEVSRHYGD